MHVVSLYVSVCAIKFISIGIIIHTFPTNILKNCDCHTAHVDQKPPGVLLCFHLPPEGVVPTLYKTHEGKKKVKTVVCQQTKCLWSVETTGVHWALSPTALPLMHLRFERWLHLSQNQ